MTKIIPGAGKLCYDQNSRVVFEYLLSLAERVCMSKTTVRFIKMSLVYLAIGVTLGALFHIFPRLRGLKYSHVHLLLLGFMAMMVYGVALHILPRFQGKLLYSDRMANVQFWLANIGLVGLAVFSGLDAYWPALPFKVLLALSGIIEVIAVYLFVANMWLTFSRPDPEP